MANGFSADQVAPLLIDRVAYQFPVWKMLPPLASVLGSCVFDANAAPPAMPLVGIRELRRMVVARTVVLPGEDTGGFSAAPVGGGARRPLFTILSAVPARSAAACALVSA